MKSLVDNIKKDIVSDMKEFEFVDEIISLETKFNKALNRYSARIICLSILYCSIVIDMTVDNDECKVRLFEERDEKEINEMISYLEKTFNKSMEDANFTCKYLKKRI